MRLTQHEDGWIYGVFCSESKDTENPDLSAAVAEASLPSKGIVCAVKATKRVCIVICFCCKASTHFHPLLPE